MQALTLNQNSRVTGVIDLLNQVGSTIQLTKSFLPIKLSTKGIAVLAVPGNYFINDKLDIKYSTEYLNNFTKVIITDIANHFGKIYLVTKDSYCEFIID